jgi:hypothetical protein
LDAFKLALDTIIVGALALPWLAIVVRIFFPGFATRKTAETIKLLTVVPENTREAVAAVLLFAVAYFVGSAVTRVADDFFDDDEIPLLPVEHTIRNHVYCEEESAWLLKELPWPWEEVNPNLGEPLTCPPPAKGDTEIDYTYEVFHLQENRLLLSGTDSTARLQRLHEQIVVLRGTALNSFVFAVLCAFGIVAEYRERKPEGNNLKKYLTYLPPLAVIALGLKLLWEHAGHVSASYSIYSHPPTMEAVVILLGVVGFFMVAPEDDRKLYKSGLLLALILGVLGYLGWWLTEVLYDQYVFHAMYSVAAHASVAMH